MFAAPGMNGKPVSWGDVGSVGAHLRLCGAAVGDEHLVGAQDGDAVRADAVAVAGRVGHRRQPADDPVLVAAAVDLGDRAGRAHARRSLAAEEAQVAAAAARLGHEQVAARAERKVPRAVVPAGHHLHRGAVGARDGRQRGQQREHADGHRKVSA
jgi:hypothetical protein